MSTKFHTGFVLHQWRLKKGAGEIFGQHHLCVFFKRIVLGRPRAGTGFLPILFCLCFVSLLGCTQKIKDCSVSEIPLSVYPDYNAATIPPNIAPLHFQIQEKGEKYHIEIFSCNGPKISLRQRSPIVKIPLKKWKRLLDENRGNDLFIDVYIKNKKWVNYPIRALPIAPEPIDSTVVYRMIGVITTDDDKQGIYQRNLYDFNVRTIFENTSTEGRSCVNCHSFIQNDPGKMSLHFRKAYPGTVFFDQGQISKYNTKTPYTMSPGAYTAWHPSGRFIAFTTNRLFEFITSDFTKTVEVYDHASDLVLYDLALNSIVCDPLLATPDRENLPEWSPDGKWLYYVSAPAVNPERSNLVGARYSLLRIPFDPETRQWGKPDTLLTPDETGRSITFPKVSPDGRNLLFGMVDYGYFTIFDQNSDLYLFNLETFTYRALDSINSSSAEGYHAWSKNGRWIVFSSKRGDQVRARPWFAYFDRQDKVHKPFVLPQEDPLFPEGTAWQLNRPVLVDGQIRFDPKDLHRVLDAPPQPVGFIGDSTPDAFSGATRLEMIAPQTPLAKEKKTAEQGKN
ncbi:MAG TPA: hypothetical protein PLK12_07465 [Prolixibacteraceae bacterium]|nr:hypothetical protein [Prolixibacteraceae bacterium]